MSNLILNHNVIETERWQRGIYFVFVYNQGVPVYSNKVILLD